MKADYIKAFLIAPAAGPIAGLFVVVFASLKLPEPYYVLAFLGLGAVLSYLAMAIVGIPLVYMLLKYRIYSLSALLFCGLVVSILLSFYFLRSRDSGLEVWLFVNVVFLVSSVSVCSLFWLLTRKSI